MLPWRGLQLALARLLDKGARRGDRPRNRTLLEPDYLYSGVDVDPEQMKR